MTLMKTLFDWQALVGDLSGRELMDLHEAVSERLVSIGITDECHGDEGCPAEEEAVSLLGDNQRLLNAIRRETADLVGVHDALTKVVRSGKGQAELAVMKRSLDRLWSEAL